MKSKITTGGRRHVLSASHVYLLALVAEVGRYSHEFAVKAAKDGFDSYIDISKRYPFERDINYLDLNGYVVGEDVPRHLSGTTHCKLYRLTPQGETALRDALDAYAIIAATCGRIGT